MDLRYASSSSCVGPRRWGALPRPAPPPPCTLVETGASTTGPSGVTRCTASAVTVPFVDGVHARTRSEEHTSELQSQSNLVCRLLLEKKKENPVCRIAARL